MPNDLFWTAGVSPHLEEEWPRPERGYNVTIQRGAVAEEEVFEGLSGNLFIDGSCVPSGIQGLARAGAAVVQANDAGHTEWALIMAVPEGLGQTSQKAEHLALAMAIGELRGEATIYSDFSNVVRGACNKTKLATDPRSRVAAIHLGSWRDPGKWEWCKEVVKVKAHQDVSKIEDEDLRWKAVGNNLADAKANEARLLHPCVPIDLVKKAEYYEKRAPFVARAMGVALSLFQPREGDLERVKGPRSAEEARQRQVHHWEFVHDRWRCRWCWKYGKGLGKPRFKPSDRCKGSKKEGELK